MKWYEVVCSSFVKVTMVPATAWRATCQRVLCQTIATWWLCPATPGKPRIGPAALAEAKRTKAKTRPLSQTDLGARSNKGCSVLAFAQTPIPYICLLLVVLIRGRLQGADRAIVTVYLVSRSDDNMFSL